MTYDNAFDGSPLARLAAWVFAWHYDQQLVDGAIIEPGSPLAMHVQRLTSDRYRHELAQTLDLAVQRAEADPVFYTARIPTHRGAVMSAVDQIEEIRQRLEGPRPVRAHGVARLRILLADGVGPFYVPGRRGLADALRAVLADL
ncbi:hypothetical protein [Mycolicibacterium brisbanense]|uniref:Uncharacterized protein n=1 Tax=Mycolicibacterium brisbanense TaxID=146020 RepID=A0A100W007_9MYCO|nr:hypothetical protein [Mycolicibacterium brisbanense]MCV7156449.1 hypothetical protein [Mycolicibacterium brisbanense]GAS89127.1 uncharacterized protein RMCB_3223 [Mycolicibacterium brisbanense]